MVDQTLPKKRGRPKGSKNKPKEICPRPKSPRVAKHVSPSALGGYFYICIPQDLAIDLPAGLGQADYTPVNVIKYKDGAEVDQISGGYAVYPNGDCSCPRSELGNICKHLKMAYPMIESGLKVEAGLIEGLSGRGVRFEDADILLESDKSNFRRVFKPKKVRRIGKIRRACDGQIVYIAEVIIHADIWLERFKDWVDLYEEIEGRLLVKVRAYRDKKNFDLALDKDSAYNVNSMS